MIKVTAFFLLRQAHVQLMNDLRSRCSLAFTFFTCAQIEAGTKEGHNEVICEILVHFFPLILYMFPIVSCHVTSHMTEWK
jgi:hypothetical protein